jgi:hypothetical protein
MLVEDMLRSKCFFQVWISHVLRFISICDLFIDSPSYTIWEGLRGLTCIWPLRNVHKKVIIVLRISKIITLWFLYYFMLQ